MPVSFLDEPAAVPGGVAGHLAQQLGIPDAGCLTQYATARGRWLHSAEIKERHGYREFADPAVHFRLARWLYALCWTGTDRPSVLFDRATAWLVTEKVLLPGASALERLVARIRARAARRLWRTLARDVTHEQRTTLDALLIAGEGGRPSPLDRLRDGPYLRSGAELSRAVSRLDEVRVLTLGLPATDHVPPGRVTALARFATVAKAQAVARMPLERRTATLLAFVRTLEATAQDDVLDLFDIVVTALFTDAAKVGKKARLRTLRDLDAAALQLRQAGGVLMDDAVEDGSVRGAAFAIVPRAMLAAALEQIDAIVRPPGDLYFIELRAQTGKLRFLRPCSDPSPSGPRRPGSQRWTRCAICAAPMGAGRLRRHRSASCRVAGSGRSKPPMAAWTASATGSVCSMPYGSGSGGETCSRHLACALPTRGSACWRALPGRQRGRLSAAPWASRPMDRPKLRVWASAWMPPTRVRGEPAQERRCAGGRRRAGAVRPRQAGRAAQPGRAQGSRRCTHAAGGSARATARNARPNQIC